MLGPETFEASDISSAIALAEDLKAQGRYDCFRGQINSSWPPRSSLARVDTKAREEAAEKIARFYHWIKASQDVLPYIQSDDQILAIAQHYSLRTPLLDLTTEPKIAGFFAIHGRKDEEYGCIYMVDRTDFSQVCEPFKEHLRIFDVEVANLWRLQAQRGLFLEARLPIEQIYPLDRIVFPHSDAPLPIDEHLIYPNRKSHLEQRLDEYFTLAKMKEGYRKVFLKPDGSPAIISIHIESEIEPETLAIQNALPSWPDDSSWKISPNEHWDHIVNRLSQEAPVISTAEVMINKELVLDLVRERRDTPDLLLIDQRSAVLRQFPQSALERLWNGMRLLPYDDEQIATALQKAIQASHALEGIPLYSGMMLRQAAKQLYGDAIEIEISSPNDLSTRAFVSTASLLQAFTAEARAQLLGDRHHSHDQVVMDALQRHYSIPRTIFDHTKMVQLFAEEIIPWQVANGRPFVLFSPHQIQYLGLP